MASKRQWLTDSLAMSIAGAVLALSAVAMGQSDPPTLDELLDLSPSDQEQEDGLSEQGDATEPEIDESVKRMLTGEQAADAFEQAVKEMDVVSLRLGRELDSGIETQRMQEAILAKLDQVIAAARKQQSSGGGGGGGGGGQSGAARQQDRGGQDVAGQGQAQQGGQQQGAMAGQSAGGENQGQAGVADPMEGADADDPLRELRQEWGNLPPRLRDEISEGLQERFSPVYRSLTEAYYQELAEQQP